MRSAPRTQRKGRLSKPSLLRRGPTTDQLGESGVPLGPGEKGGQYLAIWSTKPRGAETAVELTFPTADRNACYETAAEVRSVRHSEGKLEELFVRSRYSGGSRTPPLEKSKNLNSIELGPRTRHQ